VIAIAVAARTLSAARLPQGDEVERLQNQIAAAGPDGKELRELAIDRILASSKLTVHELLYRRLRTADDPDQVRLAVVTALQRHFLQASNQYFGGVAGAERDRVLAGYLQALARLWRETSGIAVEGSTDPLLAAARQALMRVPARELDGAARALFATATADEQLDVLWCLADLQQVLFAATIADRLDATDPTLRAGAATALQRLTCHDTPIQDRAAFTAWHERFGTWKYVDLVERAARRGTRPLEEMQQQIASLQVAAACDVVRAHVKGTPGVDWAAVQGRVVVDDVRVLDACLDILQQALASGVVADGPSPARQAFCRALLQLRGQTAAEFRHRRARLLEVAAWLGHPEETELATELVGQLLAEAEGDDPAARVAAVRGLRRYPSVDNRVRLVAIATRLLAETKVPRDEVAAILQALTARSSPRWMAPLPNDPDKADWLSLMAAGCRSDEGLELREVALQMAQVLDKNDQRVPEVFQLLLVLVRDAALATKFRVTCAIHLQGWLAEKGVADAWVRTFQELLIDSEPDLRQQAAEALSSLVASIDPKRGEWLTSTILVIRERLGVEPDPTVLRPLVACMQACGCEPGMPEKAIGALRFVLQSLPNPVPPDQLFRVEPLLSALATVAAHPRADRGQWLGACEVLAANRRRQSLRLILQNQAAIELAQFVAAADPGASKRARDALRWLLETAAMKPMREAWTATEELQREARDVRTAFSAFDTLDEALRPDSAALRLLRLDIDLFAGKHSDVVQRATAWLGNGSGRVVLGDDDKNRMRELAAAAQLQLGPADAARKLLDERTGEPPNDAGSLDLEARVGKALAANDLAGAVDVLLKVLRRTPVEDAAFRLRLVDWMEHKLKLDPGATAEVRLEADKHAALFQLPECPVEMRQQFDQLRAAR
jgi:hypothetical protein